MHRILFLGLIFLPLLTTLSASAANVPSDVAIPQKLGEVNKRGAGASRQPFIFVVSEEHVSLDIQWAVANILRYLSGVYDVKLICTEGYDKPLPIPLQGTSLLVQRSIARSDFESRNISGVEYFARAYPDVSVVGVEDMKAYELHAKQIGKRSGLRQESEQWEEDFRSFLLKDLSNITTDKDGRRAIETALEKLFDKKDFSSFTKVVHNVAGRGSTVSKKLVVLEKRWEILERQALIRLADSPEMRARDEAMVAATLRIIKEKKLDRAVLVVGHAHLGGIESLLDTYNISYISIVPAGVKKQLGGTDNESQKVYKEWQKGKGTSLERWLTRLKPSPAAARPAARTRTNLLGILATADRLRSQGLPEDQILDVVNRIPLDKGVSIVRMFAIDGGQGLEFIANGKKGYAYFADNSAQLEIPQGPKPIETGKGAGRHYAVYGGGGSNKPPIPPSGGGGKGNNPSNFPTDGFDNRYLSAIEEQRKQQPNRVTLYFSVENNGVFRRVDDGPTVKLAVTPSEVEELRKSYESVPFGTEKLFIAQQLADTLLVDLNNQFPKGRIELIQISDNDLIGDISLPLVQELARNRDASALESIDKARVYTLRSKETRRKFSSKLGKKIKDVKLPNKNRAKETIARVTKNMALKEMLSRNITKLEKGKLIPAVERLASATRLRTE